MNTGAQLKQQAYEANMLLANSGLVVLTFGNVSVLDRAAGLVAIKPSGVSYDALSAEDMVLTDLDGSRVDGRLMPSSDTPTHVRLYAAFDAIGAVVHTHSPFATAFAQAGRPIPCLGTTHADGFRGEIPVTRKMTVAEITGAYERETGNVIAERFQTIDPGERPGVLVHGHGPFAWGPTGPAAVQTACMMELVAKMACHALALTPGLEPLNAHLVDRHFLRKHGPDAYYGQKPE